MSVRVGEDNKAQLWVSYKSLDGGKVRATRCFFNKSPFNRQNFTRAMPDVLIRQSHCRLSITPRFP